MNYMEHIKHNKHCKNLKANNQVRPMPFCKTMTGTRM